MENERFDRMARLLGAGATRRAALAALLGAGVLGAGTEAARKRRRRKRKGNRPQDPPAGSGNCAIRGPGQDLSDCDFAGQDLRGANLSGSKLSGALFTNADLCAADLSGASLTGADFTSAVLTLADLRGTNLPKAIVEAAVFCRTRLPDGQLDNSGCPPGEGDVCCRDEDCVGGEVCEAQRCRCPAGTVELANGSCATPCSANSCAGTGCRCNDDFLGGPFCEIDTQIGIVCGDDADCPTGSICVGVNPTTKACRLTCRDTADCPRGSACEAIDTTTEICQQLCPPPCEDESCPGGGQCNYSGYPRGFLAPPCCPGLVCKGFPLFVCDPPG